MRWIVSADPYPHYARLRREAPVYHVEGADVWTVSRYDDVMHVLKNPEIFSSDGLRRVLLSGMGLAPGRPAMSGASIDPATAACFLQAFAKMPVDLGELLAGRSVIFADPPVHGPMRQIVNRGNRRNTQARRNGRQGRKVQIERSAPANRAGQPSGFP